MDLSRRTFLIGSAAFVAAASVPFTPEARSGAVLRGKFPWRAVEEITLSFNPTAEELARKDPYGEIELGVAGEEGVRGIRMNLGGIYRWSAMPGGEKILTIERGLVVNVRPAMIRANIAMVYNVERDPEKRGKHFCEEITWNGPGDVRCGAPLSLDPRDEVDEAGRLLPPRRRWLSRLLGLGEAA